MQSRASCRRKTPMERREQQQRADAPFGGRLCLLVPQRDGGACGESEAARRSTAELQHQGRGHTWCGVSVPSGCACFPPAATQSCGPHLQASRYVLVVILRSPMHGNKVMVGPHDATYSPARTALSHCDGSGSPKSRNRWFWGLRFFTTCSSPQKITARLPGRANCPSTEPRCPEIPEGLEETGREYHELEREW